MVDITLSRIAGSSSIPELAPDLNFVSSLTNTRPFKTITGINAIGALTTALSLTGKFAISYLNLAGLTSNDISRIKLTIDGEVKWDSTLTVNSSTMTLISSLTGGYVLSENYMCNNSLLLQIQTIADNNISLEYLARPIL